MIKKLDNKSIQNICANQVILDISACVKELLENSLDANSSTIEICLKDFGQESIIVKDNGHGISKSNFSTIIQKGATSKLNTFDDLNIISSYGFRGEALNALNQISDLTIITRTKEEICGTKLKFNKDNELIMEEDIASDVGTIIILEKIYQNFPVRLLDLKNNLRAHYQKIITLVTEYAVISLNTKIILQNEAKEKPREMIINNGHPGENLSIRILKVLGKKIQDAIIEFESKLTETFLIKGFIMKNINSGSGKENIWLKKNIAYFYVNRRPIDPPKKFIFVLGELYRQYNSNSKFIAILNFELKNEEIDFNLSPDKREIYFQNEKEMVDKFKKELYYFHEKLHSFQKSLPDTTTNKEKTIPMKRNASQAAENSLIEQMDNIIEKKKKISENQFSIIQKLTNSNYANQFENYSKQEEESNEKRNEVVETQNKKFSVTYYQPKKTNELNEIQMKEDDSENEDFSMSYNNYNPAAKNEEIHDEETDIYPKPVYKMKIYEPKKEISTNPSLFTREDSNETQRIINSGKSSKREENPPIERISFYKKYVAPENSPGPKEVSKGKKIFTMRVYEPKSNNNTGNDEINVDKIDNFKSHILEGEFTGSKFFLSNKEETIPKLIDNDSEEVTLCEINKNLAFCKENFRDLKIIGQFNVGFIIAYLKERDAIFIVDQHAADEKANYEKLIREYKFQSQMLITPMSLSNLTDIEIHTVKENLGLFEKNGFSLLLKQGEEEKPQIFIKSLPCFKNVQFTHDDFYELLKSINSFDHCSHDEIIRPSKFKSSIAYKACRSSLMVGDCLDKKTMKKLVDKLSELASPWNCPHGRPTMIKSENLSKIMGKIKISRPDINIVFPK